MSMADRGSAPGDLAQLDVSSLTLEDLDSMPEEALKVAVTNLLQGQGESTTMHTTHTNHTSHGVIIVIIETGPDSIEIVELPD